MFGLAGDDPRGAIFILADEQQLRRSSFDRYSAAHDPLLWDCQRVPLLMTDSDGEEATVAAVVGGYEHSAREYTVVARLDNRMVPEQLLELGVSENREFCSQLALFVAKKLADECLQVVSFDGPSADPPTESVCDDATLQLNGSVLPGRLPS